MKKITMVFLTTLALSASGAWAAGEANLSAQQSQALEACALKKGFPKPKAGAELPPLTEAQNLILSDCLDEIGFDPNKKAPAATR